MKRGKRGFDRKHRVADVVQKALGTILLEEMADERFRFVTVVGVEISRDCSYAKAYVSVLSDDQNYIKEVVKALNASVKTIRHALAKSVDLRITPELKFVFDQSTADGFRLDELIDQAMKRSDK